jgi:hypothetical protein
MVIVNSDQAVDLAPVIALLNKMGDDDGSLSKPRLSPTPIRRFSGYGCAVFGLISLHGLPPFRRHTY